MERSRCGYCWANLFMDRSSNTNAGENGGSEQRIVWGEEKQYQERLKKAGLSGRINTAFVERINLTIRQCVSKLTRRTWGPAKFTPELMEHLEWWRAYYHFVRYHESLEEELAQPFKEKENNSPESTGSGLRR
jgi:transposase InsO family protein